MQISASCFLIKEEWFSKYRDVEKSTEETPGAILLWWSLMMLS
jgi:hypothetical protein